MFFAPCGCSGFLDFNLGIPLSNVSISCSTSERIIERIQRVFRINSLKPQTDPTLSIESLLSNIIQRAVNNINIKSSFRNSRLISYGLITSSFYGAHYVVITDIELEKWRYNNTQIQKRYTRSHNHSITQPKVIQLFSLQVGKEVKVSETDAYDIYVAKEIH